MTTLDELNRKIYEKMIHEIDQEILKLNAVCESQNRLRCPKTSLTSRFHRKDSIGKDCKLVYREGFATSVLFNSRYFKCFSCLIFINA